MPERRIEDHLPEMVVRALKEESAATGLTVREIVLWSVARYLVNRGSSTHNQMRLKQARDLMTLLLESPTERRRVDDRTGDEDE